MYEDSESSEFTMSRSILRDLNPLSNYLVLLMKVKICVTPKIDVALRDRSPNRRQGTLPGTIITNGNVDLSNPQQGG